MTLMSPLCLSVLFLTLSAVMTDAEAEEAGCDENQFREMQADFSSCTAGYKAEYGEAVSRAEAGDLAEVSSVTSEVLIELDQDPDPGRAHSQVSDN